MSHYDWSRVEDVTDACRGRGDAPAKQRKAIASLLSADWGVPVLVIDRGGYWQILTRGGKR